MEWLHFSNLYPQHSINHQPHHPPQECAHQPQPPTNRKSTYIQVGRTFVSHRYTAFISVLPTYIFLGSFCTNTIL